MGFSAAAAGTGATSTPAVAKCGAPPASATETDKPYIKGISGVLNAVVVMSLFAPLIYTGPLENAVNTLDTFTVLCGLLSSVAWMLYSIAVLKRERCLGLIISNVAGYVANFAFLMIVCKHRKYTIKATLLIIFTMGILATIFILVQLDLDTTRVLERLFGIGGIAIVVACRVIQIWSLLSKGNREIQVVTLLCSVLPNIALGAWTLVYTLQHHRERFLIVVSSAVNCGFNLLDLLFMAVCYRNSVARYVSRVAQIICGLQRSLRRTKSEVTEPHRIMRNEDYGHLRRVNSAPTPLLMIRDAEMQAAIVGAVAGHNINAQEVVIAEQGWGEYLWATLLSIRGIQRRGPTDEEASGRIENEEAQRHNLSSGYMAPSWVSHVWMKLGDSYIGRSVVSAASLSGRWANR